MFRFNHTGLVSKSLFGVVAVLLCASVQASLLINGSFEETLGKRLPGSWTTFNNAQLPGWYTTRNFELWRTGKVAGRTPSSDGNYLLELNAHHRSNTNDPYAIYQSFNTEIGSWYEVSFDYRGRRRTQNGFDFILNEGGSEAFLNRVSPPAIAAPSAQLFDQSKPLINESMTDMSVNGWSTHTVRFQATSEQTTLGFVSLLSGTTGNLLDNVSVNAVSEASTIGLFSMATGLMLLRLRKAKTDTVIAQSV